MINAMAIIPLYGLPALTRNKSTEEDQNRDDSVLPPL